MACTLLKHSAVSISLFQEGLGHSHHAHKIWVCAAPAKRLAKTDSALAKRDSMRIQRRSSGDVPHERVVRVRSEKDPKFVYYLSAEFLMGRSLMNAVQNLELTGRPLHIMHLWPFLLASSEGPVSGLDMAMLSGG